MITEYKDICVICGAPAQHTHHLVFGRGMRPLADDDALVAPLCASCHTLVHGQGVAGAMSKIIGQMQFESDYIIENQLTGDSARYIAREKFRSRYGRSYL